MNDKIRSLVHIHVYDLMESVHECKQEFEMEFCIMISVSVKVGDGRKL